MNLSVVIPSRNAKNLRACVEALRRHEPRLPIVVIDDGLDLDALSAGGIDHCWCCSQDPLRIVSGREPFIFARNVNIGIYDTRPHDVVVLNDDALLKTQSGFTNLKILADTYPNFGIIGAVTNVTGQPLQYPQMIGLREVPDLAFIAVFIPRRTIEAIGYLDEQYCLDYGVEDLDYCEACKRAGLKVGVYDFCFVDHSSLTSTFRGDPRTSRSFAQNKELFDRKWGINQYGVRTTAG